jgi:UDP-glucose 4-epimerase
MSVAIIGAGGFIGQALMAVLRERNIAVTAISSRDQRSFDPAGSLRSDLPTDTSIDAVVYLSQSPHYRDLPVAADHVWSVNVTSALTAAAWARRCGAARFVYASTGNVYQPAFHPHVEDDPLRRDNWYALSKVHAEEALRLYGRDLRVTAARFFGVYGPTQRAKLIPHLIEAVAHRRPISLQPHPTDPSDVGGLRLSLSYIDDAATVLARLATVDGPSAINVAGPEVLSISDIAMTIGEKLGETPIFERAGNARDGDLIASTEILSTIWTGPSTAFAAGLDATVAEWSRG